MNGLINVQNIEGEEIVNARDLYSALEVARDFSTWIKDRIDKYEFQEGKDFQTHSPDLGSEKHGGQNKVDYLLSVSMAKELATVENNAKGREVRRYLIQIEEAWNSPEMVMERARQASEILIARMRARLAIVEPKAAYADEISNTEGGMSISDFAKVLASKGWQIGRNRLFNLLVESKIFFRKYEPGVKKLVAQPYQDQIEAERFLLHPVKVSPMNTIYPQARITPKGQKFVIDHLIEWEVKRLTKVGAA